jgi:hypothetical protein
VGKRIASQPWGARVGLPDDPAEDEDEDEVVELGQRAIAGRGTGTRHCLYLHLKTFQWKVLRGEGT